MRRFCRVTPRVALILLVGKAFFLPTPVVYGSPPASAPSAVDVFKIGSIQAMRLWLDELHGESVQAKGKHRFTVEFQELILKKSGESISKILELEKRANLPSRKVSDEFRAAFEKNEEILQFIIQSNEELIEELQEEKLDKVEDTQGFLDSPEWQVPHRLISLSRYWISWSRYYRSFLYTEGNPEARSILGEAIGGFSLTLFDIEDQTIIAKSLFGRALSFKELKNYEKAAADLDSITKHVRHNDPLYMWSLYEQALIAYRLGKYETALGHLDKLDTGLEEKTVSDVLGSEHKRLRERVILEPRVTALLKKLDKEGDKTGESARRLCLNAHRALKKLARHDASYATKLYRLVSDYPAFFSVLSYGDLGAIGTLALADTGFKEGQYEEAVKRYRSLWTSPDFYIRKRMDDIYFRSGYAYCQIGRWKDALGCFDDLYANFPHSNLVGKAVCLEYVAAAGRYKQKAEQSNYFRYIASAKRYLEQCPNPRDRDGAHFLLGKDYHKKGKHREAREEFTAIAENSPHYWPARYYILQSDVEDLEGRKEAGKGGAASTKRLYQDLASQFERFQRLQKNQKAGSGIAEIVPHMTILQARLSLCGPENSCGKAIKTLDGFEKRFPRNKPLWLTAMDLRLKCYREHQMIDEAKEEIKVLSEEYDVDENLWDFLSEWARAYEAESKRGRDEGNPGRADAYADTALVVYTEMSSIASKGAPFAEYLDPVLLRMAKILMARDETEQAGRIYGEILKRTPDSADALYNLGRIYEKQGRWEAALEVWRKYSKGIEDGSSSWFDSRYRIAVAHSRMGRDSEACEVITMIRVLHPDIEGAQVKEKLLSLEEEVCRTGARDQGSGNP